VACMQLTVQTLLPPTNEELNAFAWVCLSVCLTVSKYQLNNDVIITSFCFVNKSCCQTTWSTVYFATSWSACACCKSNSAVACMQLTVQTLLPPTNEELNTFAWVCLSVWLLARLLKNACMDLDEMLRVDRCRDMDELINFWARSGL